MKTSFKTPLASALVAASLVGSAQAAVSFTEDFTGPTLDAAWNQSGYLAGHLGISSGSYEMTATQGGGGNPKLQQFEIPHRWPFGLLPTGAGWDF